MWGRHSCLPVLGTFQSPDSASNRQLWSAKLENFATGRLERPPYLLGNTPLGEGGCFPVQQTASLSGAGAVVGRSLFLKTARDGKFQRGDIGTLIAYLCNRK